MAVHISSLHVGKKPPRVDKVLRLEDNVAQNRMVRSPHHTAVTQMTRTCTAHSLKRTHTTPPTSALRRERSASLQ